MRVPLLLAALVLPALLLAAAPEASAAPVPVETGVYLLNFGNFDVARGTYTMDLYLWFRWDPAAAPADFTPAAFELMNGRTTSRERILDHVAPDGMRELWYRVQANLYTDPDFHDWPFDAQRLPLAFEDAVLPAENLTYVPLGAASGVDPAVKVAGYRLASFAQRTEAKAYPFDETYSRAVFELHVEREVLGTAVKTFLPPLVFMLVSGLGFLFPPEKLALRVGAGTSMLISAVMFHISQTASLPPLGVLTLIDKIMISVYAFLALSLAITAIISVNADYWKRPDLVPRLTRYGALATFAAPFVAFALIGGI